MLKMADVIPSESQWGDPIKGLDLKTAFDRFYGKSRSQAVSLFSGRVIEFSSSLNYMPSYPFRYYLFSFVDFVLLGKELSRLDAPDAAACLFDVVMRRLDECHVDVVSVFDELLPSLQYVSDHQYEYGARPHIYGFFEDKLDQIKEVVKKKR